MAVARPCRRAARHSPRLVLSALLGAGALAWQGSRLCAGFVAADVSRGRASAGLVARRAYEFDLAEKEEYDNLKIETVEETGHKRVSTRGDLTGNWNTVLGSTELPAKGKSYWEVKIVKKANACWEYIGVTEPNCDVTRKLAKNLNGCVHCWGGSWDDSSFTYTWLKMEDKWNKKDIDDAKELQQAQFDMMGPKLKAQWDDKKKAEQFKVREGRVKNNWKTKLGGAIVGMRQDMWPRITEGMVIGVEVDMDKGTLGYWADGRYLGLVKDTYGKPAELKGKKYVPAMSVFGRVDGGGRHDGTVLELRTGLEPPAPPE